MLRDSSEKIFFKTSYRISSKITSIANSKDRKKFISTSPNI